MNTGIGDAYGLGWMLAAVLRGFAGPGLLEAYKQERLPVWQRNLAGSRRHNAVRVEIAALYGPVLQDEGPQGDSARASAAARIAEIGNAENESHGSSSAITTPARPRSRPKRARRPRMTRSATCPRRYPAGGCPASTCWTAGGLRQAWPVVHCAGHGGRRHVTVRGVAEKRGLPLEILRYSDPLARQVYDADMVLVRPDQHVAWRGNEVPARGSAATILDRTLGWPIRTRLAWRRVIHKGSNGVRDCPILTPSVQG